jgi:putative transposase
MSDVPGPRRKRTRLPLPAYADPGTLCSVTIGLHRRRPVFAAVRAAATAVEILREHATKTGVPIYGYCVMPDHVHLVLGPSVGCDIVTFVGQFKNLAQRAVWKLGLQGKLWQVGFYDHFLRLDEQIERVVEYVLDNPVRMGLVAGRGEYPFSGSLVFDP